MPAELNQTAIQNLKTVLTTGSFLNAKTPTPGFYDLATYFTNGWGRAYVGFSESSRRCSRMHVGTSTSKSCLGRPTLHKDKANFFADVIAVNPTVHQSGTRALAVQLANVMAATQTMVKTIGASQDLPPQYLMATRPSIFNILKQNNRIYAKMYDLTQTSNPVMFKLNSQAPTWLSSMQGTIKNEVLSNPTCGCDFPAVQTIQNNSAAAAICTATCSSHGVGVANGPTNIQPFKAAPSADATPVRPHHETGSQTALKGTSGRRLWVLPCGAFGSTSSVASGVLGVSDAAWQQWRPPQDASTEQL